MTFNSWEFLIFYPVVLALYFLLPKRARWPMLLLASYFFYACYQLQLLPLILLTTLISWLASRFIERTGSTVLRRLALSLVLVVCLGVLFFYKYFDFLSLSAYSLVRLWNADVPLVVLNLVLPVGISFYTFQTLSYVIDVYRGDVEAEKNFFFYALFVSFFPQLVAGPIERPSNLIVQLKEAHAWSDRDAVKGAKHMLVGFFKKIVVADTISVYVDAVYNHPSEATGLGVVIATVLFAVQIYCDFSGYTDIAIGCARIMGIRLMKNFDHPYRARSIKEFWSRWHISLSGWFRDYLYIPLGGNRKGRTRRYINLFLVFLISGLWHGANWTFVIWGAVHGVYQILGHATLKLRDGAWRRIGLSPDSRAVGAVRCVGTFLLVCFAWIFFRAGSVLDALVLVGKLFGPWEGASQTLESMGLTLVPILITVFSLLTLLMIDSHLKYEDTEGGSEVLVGRGAFVYFVWIILLAWVALLSKGLSSTFIYFQF